MDRRTIKSKMAIRESFLSLLKQHDIHKISVAELSRKANIGRGTFYLHYQDIYDLYHQIETEFYTEFSHYFDTLYPKYDSDDLLLLVKSCNQFIERNKDIFLFLIQKDPTGQSLNKLKELLLKKILLGYPRKNLSTFDIVESKFIVSGVVGILEDWQTKDVDWSQEQITEMLHTLIMRLI